MLIIRPHITEKSIRLADEQNKYTFVVSLDANKRSAAKELNEMFGVEVVDVKTNTRLGKHKNYGRNRVPGRTAHRKFMVFKLKDGDTIDLFSTK